MSQENINTVRALHAAFTGSHLEQATSFIGDDFEWKIVAFGMLLKGRDGFRQGFQAFANPFPGATLNYKNVADSGDQVVVEYDFVGIHTGALLTPAGAIPPTGRPIHLPGIEVFRVRDGKIVSLHTYFDSATLLAQLGDVPTRMNAAIRLEENKMSLEENKQLVRELMARLDARDIDGVVSYCAPDAVWHGFTPQPLDNAGYRQAIQVFLDAFPDSRFVVRHLVAEGDEVAAPHQLRGTHNGAFQGIPPTGKPVVVDAIAIFRIADNKVAQVWLNAEILGLLMQIGAIPASA